MTKATAPSSHNRLEICQAIQRFPVPGWFDRFALIEDSADLYEQMSDLTPSDAKLTIMPNNQELANLMNIEKAWSELLVAALRRHVILYVRRLDLLIVSVEMLVVFAEWRKRHYDGRHRVTVGSQSMAGAGVDADDAPR